MSDFRGELVCLAEAALPSLSSATTPFSAVVTTAKAAASHGQMICKVTFTVRAFPMTVTAAGTTPTAGANGVEYPIGTYDFYGNANTLSTIKAIQNGGATTGYVQVWATPL